MPCISGIYAAMPRGSRLHALGIASGLCDGFIYIYIHIYIYLYLFMFICICICINILSARGMGASRCGCAEPVCEAWVLKQIKHAEPIPKA